jgi:hypothetical protein
MRFHFGPPPADPEFQPEVNGWTPLREPKPLLLNVMAVPISILAVVVLAVAWNRAPTISVNLESSIFGRFAPLVYVVAVLFVGFLGLVFVHELIHALGCPQFGFSRHTVLGVWPSRLLFYTGHTGGMSRNRWLIIYLLPFLVLSVLPLLVCRTFDLDSPLLHIVSVVHGLFSGGDIVLVLLILLQVPGAATMQNQGWSTWWTT